MLNLGTFAGKLSRKIEIKKLKTMMKLKNKSVL